MTPVTKVSKRDIMLTGVRIRTWQASTRSYASRPIPPLPRCTTPRLNVWRRLRRQAVWACDIDHLSEAMTQPPLIALNLLHIALSLHNVPTIRSGVPSEADLLGSLGIIPRQRQANPFVREYATVICRFCLRVQILKSPPRRFLILAKASPRRNPGDASRW